MNAIVIEENELEPGAIVVLTGERGRHICQVIKPEVGQKLKAVLVDKQPGSFEVTSLDAANSQVVGRFIPIAPAVEPSILGAGNLSLIIAMPRPKELKRILRFVAMAGISEVTLIRAYRVDKSYLKSPVIENCRQYFNEGLAQSGNYRLPKLKLAELFRPFVEDTLPQNPAIQMGNAVLLHPSKVKRKVEPLAHWLKTRSFSTEQKYLLIFGPEGGWIDFELELLKSLPLCSLGEPIWTTQSAIQIAIGQLLAWSQVN